MLDSTVKFEDMPADVIAMEDVAFEDVDQDTLTMEHFSDMQQELNMDSVWSIWDGGCMDKDTLLFKNKQYLVRYQTYSPTATCEEIYNDAPGIFQEHTMFAPSGSIKDLWFAANSCIIQSGTHHHYIEDFEVQEDGSLMLATGS